MAPGSPVSQVRSSSPPEAGARGAPGPSGAPRPAGTLVFPIAAAWALSERTHILAVLNVTPDSFSDGGRFLDPGAAADHAARMIGEGADGIDIGGESTRPGAQPVPYDEQRRRVLPVLERLRRAHPAAALSVDTTLPALARDAMDAGADMINDISALRGDPAMSEVARATNAAVVLMHMQGTPATMQRAPRYGDPVREIGEFLEGAARQAEAAGIRADGIVIDPGLGFGKTVAHNLALLRGLPALAATRRPVLVGASRKSFLGALTGCPVEDRLEGSLAAAAAAVLGGASVLRVHDVAPTARLLRVLDAVVRA